MMITNFNSYEDFLRSELVRRIQTNPLYSMRAFARNLTLSPGELSEILNSKRPLSIKSAIKISRSLDFNQEETQHLLHMIATNKNTNNENTNEKKPQIKTLTLDTFHMVSDWFCFAIINLAECKGFKWKPSYISKRLGISEHEVTQAIKTMERLELITKTLDGYKITSNFVSSPEGIPSEAIRNFHISMFKKSEEALINQPVNERGFYGMSFAVDPKYIDEMKKEISQFHDRLTEKYNNKGIKSEVYHIETGIFKLSRSEV